jgi:hypothetical protein
MEMSNVSLLLKSISLFIISSYYAVVKKQMRKHRPLKYIELLARRSAVPAVHSRASVPNPAPSGSLKPRIRVSAAEKARLLRTAHRTKNPLEAVQGRSNLPASEAVKRSGKYDVWASENPDEASLVHSMRTSEAKEYLLPIVKSHKSRVGALVAFYVLSPHLSILGSTLSTTFSPSSDKGCSPESGGISRCRNLLQPNLRRTSIIATNCPRTGS